MLVRRRVQIMLSLSLVQCCFVSALEQVSRELEEVCMKENVRLYRYVYIHKSGWSVEKR